MGFLPLVAKQIRRNACENDAAAHQALKRRRPERHDDHENAAQNKRHRDEKTHLERKWMKKLLIVQIREGIR